MVCYVVPLLAAVVHHGMRTRMHGLRDDVHQKWLTLMLSGAATFGVVDHLWNGELFLISANLAWDLALGAAITAAVAGLWAAFVGSSRRAASRAGA